MSPSLVMSCRVVVNSIIHTCSYSSIQTHVHTCSCGRTQTIAIIIGILISENMFVITSS